MKASEIRTIAVVGSGDMGHGIGEVAAMSGYKVNMYDIKQEFVDRGIGKIRDSLAKQVSKQKMSQADMDNIMGSIKGFTDLKEAVKDVDFTIEAAPEILDLKLKIFKDLDEFARKDAILASNTSSMSITKMCQATSRPDKVVGLHFFNPVAMMLLVEVIRGNTSDETMNVTRDLVSKWKNLRGAMSPIMVNKDTPGFVFNRINAPVRIYLSDLLEKGLITPEGVDAKMRQTGVPMGPFETMDYAGLDIGYSSSQYFANLVSQDFAPRSWMKNLVEAGHYGKKTGKGIFEWPGGARPTIDMNKADPNFDPMDLVCIRVNEATKLMEDEVATDPVEIDKAMVNGSGAAAGPFTLARGMGWAKVAERCESIAQKTGVKWFEPTETLKKGNIKI